MNEQGTREFKVVDRRHSAQPEASGETAGETGATREAVSEGPAEESNERPEERRRPHPLPEVTFATFVLSLNTSALLHLGEIPDPAGGEKRQDLSLAQHAIDTLAMLQGKTAGNLSADETALLEHILFDLRMRFVRAKP